MILFKTIRYKNLLSTGNTFTEIVLDAHKTTLINSINGSGKSTVLDSIIFALYGRPHRKINKPQLINSINKRELLVEIEFLVDGIPYMIRRGMRPNIFEIYKEGNLINQEAATKDYQRFLEDSILKLNYKSFEQVVILGSSTYVPFMELPLAQRRAVIEDLLDIQIFTVMNTLLKQEISEAKSEYINLKHDITLAVKTRDLQEEHNDSIRNLQESENVKRVSRIKEYEDKIEDNNQRIQEYSNEMVGLAEGVINEKELESRRIQLNTLKGQLTGRNNSLNKEIAFYEDNDNCPTCHQPIDEYFKNDIIKEKSNTIQEISHAIESLENRQAKLDKEWESINSFKADIQKTKKAIDELNISNQIYHKSIVSIKKEIEESRSGQADFIDNSDINRRIKEMSNRLLKMKENQDVMGLVAMMLKDSGIKSHIVKQYIPIINQLVNKYLAALDFFIDFQLDDTFNEKIISPNKELFSYNSFSEGEKLRINISLMFAWRQISKIRNSTSTNLLFMDEILDSSLDQAGADEFLKLIKNLTDRDNVIIISHKGDSLIDHFDRVLRFKKEKGFSHMEIVEE